ncbi:MAG: ankyrin repeat domain-containing protein [Planctomycetota bacterium]
MKCRWEIPFLLGCILSLICLLTDIGQEKVKGCTIGVASGKATADGRPLLWKNRDGSYEPREVVYFTDGRFKYLAMVTADDWQLLGGGVGVNEFGFCIVGSSAFDLPKKSKKGLGSHPLMKMALQQCVTVDDFENILKQTNVLGRRTVGNIGVIDAFGGASIFETENFSYARFDATDPKVAPKGYIVRANFTFIGGGDFGRARYDRANHLWQQAIDKGKLDYRYVLRHICRDFSGAEEVSHILPEMEATKSNTIKVLRQQNVISNGNTGWAALFHGVRPNENPSLTTFWAIMGEPIFSVALPSWVIAESTSAEMDGEEFSPLCTAAHDLYLSNYVTGDKGKFLLYPDMLPDIWSVTYSAEDRIFDQTESIMARWRQDYPMAKQVASFHQHMASEAMNTLQEVTELLKRKDGPMARLRIALHMRCVEKAKAFIEGCININVSDGHGYTPLHYAVQNNQKEIVHLLISKNANVTLKTRLGQTPLHIALDRGNKDIVELLLTKGADINAADNTVNTSLHNAARNGQRDIIGLLIDKGADINATNKSNQTSLDIAVQQNHREIVELLLTNGAKASSIFGAAGVGDLATVKAFLEKGVDANARGISRGWTALHIAAINGHKEVIKLLLENGADVNAGHNLNRTAAEYAIRGNHNDIVELLISKGADVSPLHLAISKKDETKARRLIEAGADVNKRTQYGTTPLHIAVYSDLKNIVKLLISKGADVNNKDNWDWTPLHSAVYSSKDMVELLIDKGADTTARDGNYRAPLWYAKKRGHAEIIDLLRKHGAKE